MAEHTKRIGELEERLAAARAEAEAAKDAAKSDDAEYAKFLATKERLLVSPKGSRVEVDGEVWSNPSSLVRAQQPVLVPWSDCPNYPRCEARRVANGSHR